MSEQYVPPEAQGEPPKNTPESRKSFLGAFKSYADKKLVSLALAAGIFFGPMNDAEGRKAQTVEPGGKKDPTHETSGEKKFDIDERKETEDGVVRYRFDDIGETTIGEVKGREYLTVLDIHDEGDPNVKGDEYDAECAFYRFDGENGVGDLVSRTKTDGSVNPRENPFGRIDGFPESFRKKGSPDLERLSANLDLQGFWDQLRVVRGFRAMGKENTPEAKKVQEDLERGIKNFQAEHPDVSFSPEVHEEVFGG